MRYVLITLLLVVTSIGFANGHTSNTIPAPNFDQNKYIIDPDNLINEKNEKRLLPLKETYFFKRLIEPIVIAVESVTGNGEEILKQYVQRNAIETATNGRYIIQLYIKNESRFLFSLGSQLKPIYESNFLQELDHTYGPKMKFDNFGSYQFVVFQKLGSYLVDKVAFYYNLKTNANYIVPSYPTGLALASKKFESISYTESTGDRISQSDSHLEQANHIIMQETVRKEDNKNLPNSPDVDYNQISYEYRSGAIESIADVPNQRRINNVWVSNPHKIITKSEANQIDLKLKGIEANTGYEIAVVLLNSINNQDAFDFGLRLFNSWGIGKKNKNNGLLVKVVLNPRALTFITGAGTELVLSDATTYNIGQDYIKPSFRQGQYAKGLLKGLDKIEKIFEGNEVPTVNHSNYESATDYSNYPWYDRYPALFFYCIIAGVLLAIYCIVLLIAVVFIKDLHRRYHVIKFFNLLIFPILFPIPFGLIFFFNKFVLNRWRNTVRFGELKGEIMHKLEEEEEDEYLSQGQVTEERIKSIDYDVWVTASHSEILILGYKDWFNKYRRCPKCTHKTYFKEYDKTIRAATYTSKGSGQTKYYCENCKHQKIRNYTIPKLVKSKSNYSSGGSSWGGGSSWSGGGSSFGGGFSGGGGSSSGW